MSQTSSYVPPAAGEKATFDEVLINEIKLIRERRRLLEEGRQHRCPADAVEARTASQAKKGASLEEPQGQEPAAGEETTCAACEQALQEDLTGLSISGGGIRSATFSLGIIQALARLGLLSRFDYLSTVSGGGYIGSWLTGLLHRASQNGETASILEVEERLKSRQEDTPIEADRRVVEDPAIRFLRKFSNYLTPNVGFFSADTWTVLTNYLRNLLLVLATLIAGIGLVLIVPRIVHSIATAKLTEPVKWEMGIALVLATIAVIVVGCNLGSSSEEGVRKWVNGRKADKKRQGFSEKGGSRAAGTKVQRPAFLGQGWVLWTVVLPLLLAAVGATLGLYSLEEPIGKVLLEKMPGFSGQEELPLDDNDLLLVTVLGTALAYFFSWVLAGGVAWVKAKQLPKSVRFGQLILWALPAGLLGGLMLFGIDQLLSRVGNADKGMWQALTWGAPMVLVGYVLTATVHIGLVGRKLHDYDREWLSRVGAWLLLFAAGWAALFAFTVYGTPLVYRTADWLRWALTAGWLGATLAGLWASRGKEGNAKSASLTRAIVGKVAPYLFVLGLLLWLGVGIDWVLSLSKEGTAISTQTWTSFMETRDNLAEQPGEEENEPRSEAPVEGPSAEMATRDDLAEPPGEEESEPPSEAAVEDPPTEMLTREDTAEPPDKEEKESPSEAPVDDHSAQTSALLTEVRESNRPAPFTELVEAHYCVLKGGGLFKPGVLFGILLALFLLLGWRVDVNEFSMHRLYRNRLVRCYLAASLDKATRDSSRQPFTGFNLRDDILLEHLGPLHHIYAGPYHLVNTALNLVAGSELAWQERKAASFIFSPLYCGFSIPDLECGYRRTPGYGSHQKDLTLGTAMAISGAAASPNMGFRTSPALSFLLTVFNLRLGWWLGNPSEDRLSRNFARQPLWKLSGPSFAVTELMGELFGLTREDEAFVYLSDGGHFENLGVYELVKRRCRFIVACDGGADPDVQFDDLGNAIRKCRVDLGIEIEIDPRQIRLSEDGLSRWHWAIGTIRYTNEEQGTLLYLKSSLTGDEPEDILNYDAEHPEFPHQTTGDQWFDESQFESYRRLGEHVALGALRQAVAEATADGRTNMELLTQVLKERWHAPRKSRDGTFTHHGRKLDALYKTLRTSEHLEFLSEQFYPEWRSLMTGEPDPKAPAWLPPLSASGREQLQHGFYFCNQLIQLMENIYLDLDLEEQWAHPDNRGWINLFKHWSWSGMFQVTWAISASTYGLRFQRFCLRRLGLDLVCDVEVEKLTKGRDITRPLTLDECRELLEGRSELNFVERDIIRDVLQRKGNRIHRVFSFQVVVKDPVVEGSHEDRHVRFSCGFALVQDQRLVCFRIQDHLRTMGLARRALKVLISEHKLEGVSKLVEMSSENKRLFLEDPETRLEQLFRSVQREVEQGRGS